MSALLRILLDVAVDRLRKREMANLAASVSVMLVLSLPAGQVVGRTVFGVLLNLFAYLVNDLYDVDADLLSPHKNCPKAEFLTGNRTAARRALVALVTSLVLVGGLTSLGLLLVVIAAGGSCWLYSAKLKGRAFLDIASVGFCGLFGVMIAFPLDRTLGWLLAGQLALFAATFQSIQLLRDRQPDASFGTQTTAVVLGFKRTVQLHRWLIVVSAVYCMLFLHWAGIALVVPTAYPIRLQDANRHWNRVRVVFGVFWLVLMVWLAFTGRTAGFAPDVSATATLPWPSFLR